MKLKKGVKKIIFIVIIAIVLLGFIIYLFVNNTSKDKVEVSKVVNEISKYGYELRDNKSKLYNEKFEELKEILDKDTVNEEEYAKVIAEMFIIDFYTLNDKVAKTDIGGVDFIHSSEREDFLEKAMDTIYKYIESNLYGNRNQKLPTVSAVKVENIEMVEFEYLSDIDKKAYQVKLNWDYKDDMGYEDKATLILVHEDNKLAIVEMD